MPLEVGPQWHASARNYLDGSTKSVCTKYSRFVPRAPLARAMTPACSRRACRKHIGRRVALEGHDSSIITRMQATQGMKQAQRQHEDLERTLAMGLQVTSTPPPPPPPPPPPHPRIHTGPKTRAVPLHSFWGCEIVHTCRKSSCDVS